MQLAQAIGEAAFEKSLREKVTQENTSCRWEVGKLRQQLEVRLLAECLEGTPNMKHDMKENVSVLPKATNQHFYSSIL